MKLEFNKIYNALIAIQVLYKHFNPIPYGISIPAVLRGGVKNTPPAKNIFRSVIFQFFYTYNESYVQLAKIKKKIQNWKNSTFFNPIPYGISIPAVLQGGGMKCTSPAKNILRSVRFQFFDTCN